MRKAMCARNRQSLLICFLCEFVNDRLDMPQPKFGCCGQDRTCLGQGQMFVVTVKQLTPKMALEFRNKAADRGLSHSEFLRSGGKIQLACCRFKYAERVQDRKDISAFVHIKIVY